MRRPLGETHARLLDQDRCPVCVTGVLMRHCALNRACRWWRCRVCGSYGDLKNALDARKPEAA